MITQATMEKWLGGFMAAPEDFLKAHPQVVEEFNSVLLLASQELNLSPTTLKNSLDHVLPKLEEMKERLKALGHG